MAATNYTPISLYYSTTASAAPTAGNLVNGELAINIADGKLFYKDSGGTVQVLATKGGVGSSSTTQVLYNSRTVFFLLKSRNNYMTRRKAFTHGQVFC